MDTNYSKTNPLFPGEKGETLAFMDICGRVSNLLLDIARVQGEWSDGGGVKIQRPSEELIANQIGASGEAVAKAIKTLVSREFIVTRNHEIFIHQKQFEIL